MNTPNLYEDKRPEYFNAVGAHILSRLPTDAHRVLEIGCGAGVTGSAAKARSPDMAWTGVEMFPEAAAAARDVLDHVFVGDIAQLNPHDLGGPFDAIVASEVLEHLVDPWLVVRQLTAVLRKDGLFIASSPNVANRQIIAELVRGRFEYQEEGMMDQTHLRWFTPDSFARMFSDAGLKVLTCEPLVPLRQKAALLNRLTAGRFRHLFVNQLVAVAQRI